MSKIYNAIIIGPSSSGKTSIVNYLSKKYSGIQISLDGVTSSGRPLNSVVSNVKPKSFTKESIGVLIRKLMIEEALKADNNNKPWFIDDVSEYIFKLIPSKLKKRLRIILILPTINKLVENVLIRNKEAKVASEERYISSVMIQMKNFIKIKKYNGGTRTPNTMLLSNKEVIDALNYDKIYYSVDDKLTWEEEANDVLAKLLFIFFINSSLRYF